MAEARADGIKIEKFDPSDHPDNLLESFNEFVSAFAYTYEAIAKEPPSTLEVAAKTTWISQNKRKVFLGKFSSRCLQRELEEATTETERLDLTVNAMVTKLRERFGIPSNTTLSN